MQAVGADLYKVSLLRSLCEALIDNGAGHNNITRVLGYQATILGASVDLMSKYSNLTSLCITGCRDNETITRIIICRET